MKHAVLLARIVWGPFSWRRSVWRLGLLVAPWLIALSIPPARDLLLQTSPASDIALWCRQTVSPSYTPVAFDTSAELHPNDLAAQFYSGIENPTNVLFGGGEDGNTAARARQTVDRCLANFPNVPWLLAYRLSLGIPVDAKGNQLIDARVASPLEHPFPWQGVMPVWGGYGSTSRTSRPQNLAQIYVASSKVHIAPAVLKKLCEAQLACALRGQKLEPQNCFFDLYVARYLFSLSRDHEALAVLHRAASKSYYSSHQGDQMMARLDAAKLVSPVRNDDLSVLDTLNRRDWTQLRHMFQLATVNAAYLEVAGQHAGALKIYGDLMRLCVTMRDGSYSADEAFASCAFAAIVWAGVNRPVTLREVKSRNPKILAGDWLRIGADKFAVYAIEHGRTDLATQARAEGQRFAVLRERLEPISSPATYWPVPHLGSFKWLELWMDLMDAVLAGFVWMVIIRVVVFFFLAPGGLIAPRPTDRDVVRLVGVVFLLVAGATALCLVLNFQNINDQNLVTHLILELESLAVVVAFTAPIFMTAVLVAVAAVRRQRAQSDSGLSLHHWVSANLRALRDGEDMPGPMPTVSTVAANTFRWTPIMLSVLCFLFWLIGTSDLLSSFHDVFLEALAVVVTLVSAVGSLLGWILRWRFNKNIRYRASAHAALGCYREALSWWTTLLGWLVLASLLLASMPYLSEQRQLTSAVQRGELKTILQLTPREISESDSAVAPTNDDDD